MDECVHAYQQEREQRVCPYVESRLSVTFAYQTSRATCVCDRALSRSVKNQDSLLLFFAEEKVRCAVQRHRTTTETCRDVTRHTSLDDLRILDGDGDGGDNTLSEHSPKGQWPPRSALLFSLTV